jgi:hypothetical protein
MFFSLHFTSSSIDTIMERPSGFTLEELLEEDELLQECKAQNAKLTEYLSTPAILYKLAAYVTEMPDASDSDVRKYKYPFVATEVLSCDMPALRDAVTGEPAVLKQLFSLLATPPPLPPVLAGYACKVLKSLEKQTLKAVLQAEGMPDQRTLVQQLLTHIGSDAILALLIALCIGEPPVSEPSPATHKPAATDTAALATPTRTEGDGAPQPRQEAASGSASGRALPAAASVARTHDTRQYGTPPVREVSTAPDLGSALKMKGIVSGV